MSNKPTWTRADGLARLQAECMAVFGSPLYQEQVDCYMDPARLEEAYAMLDDMEARLEFDVTVARMALDAETSGK